jgi:hypothetical protein
MRNNPLLSAIVTFLDGPQRKGIALENVETQIFNMSFLDMPLRGLEF